MNLKAGDLCLYWGASATKRWRGGWRLCVVQHKGRRWAVLTDVGTFSNYKVPVDVLNSVQPAPDTADPSRVAALFTEKLSLACTKPHQRATINKCLRVLPRP